MFLEMFEEARKEYIKKYGKHINHCIVNKDIFIGILEECGIEYCKENLSKTFSRKCIRLLCGDNGTQLFYFFYSYKPLSILGGIEILKSEKERKEEKEEEIYTGLRKIFEDITSTSDMPNLDEEEGPRPHDITHSYSYIDDFTSSVNSHRPHTVTQQRFLRFHEERPEETNIDPDEEDEEESDIF